MRQALAAIPLILLAGCIVVTEVRPARPVTWHYYDDAGVYYRPDTRIYYYRVGGTWRRSTRPPVGVVLHHHRVVMERWDHPRDFHHGPAAPPRHAVDVTWYYYPDCGWYYRRDTGRYYHLDGGTWVVTTTIPGTLVLGAHVVETCSHNHPRDFHDRMRRHHPGRRRRREVPVPPAPTITWRCYPDAGLYYRIDTRQYYHLRNGIWVVATDRPRGLVLGSFVTEVSTHAHPQLFHAALLARLQRERRRRTERDRRETQERERREAEAQRRAREAERRERMAQARERVSERVDAIEERRAERRDDLRDAVQRTGERLDAAREQMREQQEERERQRERERQEAEAQRRAREAERRERMAQARERVSERVDAIEERRAERRDDLRDAVQRTGERLDAARERLRGRREGRRAGRQGDEEATPPDGEEAKEDQPR